MPSTREPSLYSFFIPCLRVTLPYAPPVCVSGQGLPLTVSLGFSGLAELFVKRWPVFLRSF